MLKTRCQLSDRFIGFPLLSVGNDLALGQCICLSDFLFLLILLLSLLVSVYLFMLQCFLQKNFS